MKLRTHIALALLVAAVAVPVAYSGTDRPARADASDVVSRYLSNQARPTATDGEDVVFRYLSNRVRPTRADAPDVVSRYLSDQALALAAPQPSVNGAGFDWADAGIGAGGMLVIMLLAGAAALGMRKGRRHLMSA